jgi:hypothetical protein
MSLPQSAEYHEAIQSSRSSFIDAELKVATNDGPVFMGVPGGPVASGNFAIVYRFRNERRRLAVKCFTREKTDQQTRYQLIHEHLAAQRLPWTIDFTYIKEGIRVKGKTYPVVKMEWIENAKTLLSHISDTVSARQSLDSVCDQFYRMVADLRKHSIAHGDLQHANLIISDGKLLLIDYDGMCVPKTAGLKSEEDGLPDYQHPRRHGGTLHPSMDHFSTLVIWTSLYALTIDPTLWGRWVGDDERLLFRKQDFIHPESSPLMRELQSFRDSKLNSAIEAIAKASALGNLWDIPHLSDVVLGDSKDQTPWWQQEVNLSNDSAVNNTQLANTLPPWMAPSNDLNVGEVFFTGGGVALKTFTALTIAVTMLSAVMGMRGAIAPLVSFAWIIVPILACVALIRLAYTSSPQYHLKLENASKMASAVDLERAKSQQLEHKRRPFLLVISNHENAIKGGEAKLRNVESKLNDIKKAADSRIRSFASEQYLKKSNAEKVVREVVIRCDEKKASSKAKYEAKCRQCEQDIANAKASFSKQLDDLNRNKDALFNAKVDELLVPEMLKISIHRVTASGASMTDLEKFGFRTLADFTGVGYEFLKHRNGKFYKIRGIGYVRAQQMEAMRLKCVDRIKKTILSHDRARIEALVNADYETERNKIQASLDQAILLADLAKKIAESDYKKIFLEALREENEAKSKAKTLIELVPSEIKDFESKVREKEALESESLRRELWALQSVVNPARHLIQTEKTKMRAAVGDLEIQVAAAKKDIQNAQAHLAACEKITFLGFVKHLNSPVDVKRSSGQDGMWFFLIFICAWGGLVFYLHLRGSMTSKSDLNTTVYGTSKQQVDLQIYSYRQEDSSPKGSSSPQKPSASGAPLVPNDNNNQTAPLIEKTPPAQQPLLKQTPSEPKSQKKTPTTRPSSPEKFVKKDGIDELLRMAEAGDLQAQSQLAHQYSTGKGTKVNHEEAFRWNLLAAKRGSSRAQSNLGVAYANGYAVDADIVEGYAWWYIASQAGSAHARGNMQLYENILTDKQKAQAIARAKVLSKKGGD